MKTFKPRVGYPILPGTMCRSIAHQNVAPVIRGRYLQVVRDRDSRFVDVVARSGPGRGREYLVHRDALAFCVRKVSRK